MKNIALVVIDVQEDFLPPSGSLAVSGGREIISPICNLVSEYPWLAVVLTQDWHPPNHCLFAKNNNAEPFTEVEFSHPLAEKDDSGVVISKKQVVWPVHCVQDLKGACIDDRVLSVFEEIKGKVPAAIVRKGYLEDREYYLCFCDCWKLHNTEMTEFLKENHITEVVFVGLAYDFCVLNSSADCLERGFKTYVLRDCCRSVYPDSILATEVKFREAGVHIYDNVDSLLKELS